MCLKPSGRSTKIVPHFPSALLPNANRQAGGLFDHCPKMAQACDCERVPQSG
jgi:hypothetical protein